MAGRGHFGTVPFGVWGSREEPTFGFPFRAGGQALSLGIPAGINFFGLAPVLQAEKGLWLVIPLRGSLGSLIGPKKGFLGLAPRVLANSGGTGKKGKFWTPFPGKALGFKRAAAFYFHSPPEKAKKGGNRSFLRPGNCQGKKRLFHHGANWWVRWNYPGRFSGWWVPSSENFIRRKFFPGKFPQDGFPSQSCEKTSLGKKISRGVDRNIFPSVGGNSAFWGRNLFGQFFRARKFSPERRAQYSLRGFFSSKTGGRVPPGGGNLAFKSGVSSRVWNLWEKHYMRLACLSPKILWKKPCMGG